MTTVSIKLIKGPHNQSAVAGPENLTISTIWFQMLNPISFWPSPFGWIVSRPSSWSRISSFWLKNSIFSVISSFPGIIQLILNLGFVIGAKSNVFLGVEWNEMWGGGECLWIGKHMGLGFSRWGRWWLRVLRYMTVCVCVLLRRRRGRKGVCVCMCRKVWLVDVEMGESWDILRFPNGRERSNNCRFFNFAGSNFCSILNENKIEN